MASLLNHNDPQSEQPNVLASTTATTKRVDFVSDLPWEIVKYNLVPRILGEVRLMIHLDRPIAYMRVCSNWSKRILLADDSIYFYYGDEIYPDDDYDIRTRMMAPYIKWLSIRKCSEEHIGRLLKCGKLVRLNHLYIPLHSPQVYRRFHQLLQIIPTLTHLNIDYGRFGTPLAIWDVLDQCPKLIRLKIDLHLYATMDTANSQVDRPYGNVTHLQVICWDPMKNDIYIPLIKRLPNLCLLALTLSSSPAGLNIIQQHCPKLQGLYLSQRRVNDVGLDEISQQQQQQQQEGLRLLSLAGGTYDEDDIAALMVHNHDTLESIVLEGQFFTITPTRALRKDPVQFNNLRSLSYRYQPHYRSIDFYEWILQCAPNLESVETVNAATQRHVLDRTFSDDGPLKRIGLYCARDEQQPYERQFLKRHIQRGVESRLEHLKCTLERTIRDRTWVYLIPQLNQLKTLEVAFTADGKIHELGKFLKQVACGCTALEKVIFKTKYFPPSSEWILHLATHRTLQHLVIDTEDIPDDLTTHLEAFGHLKSLHLNHDITAFGPILELKRKLPFFTFEHRHEPK